ncbi:MAG: hypothetical protein K2R98_00635 [Gemmataceae bacterium]|nr:hypothetical protein [Gemmataceae bacterium]
MTACVIPVLDLKEGIVVRGIAGRRDQYRPIDSRLSPSTLPGTVADAFREHFGLTHLYLADLDAIAGRPPALMVYRELRSRGFRLWVDAGVRALKDALLVADEGVEGIVIGLETLHGPRALAEMVHRFGTQRIVFSLDLKEGQPLGVLDMWQQPDADGIANEAVVCGVRQMIVLDLAHVGMDGGTGTESLCQRLATTHPDLEIVAGGGVRDGADLRRLAEHGVHAVLVASALHDGRLSRADF